MADAPIAARAWAATDYSVFGGPRMIVWGGRDAQGGLLWDGAQYDIERDRWYRIPASPLAPRSGFAFETGGNGALLIWGGVDSAGTPLGDGAIYQNARSARNGTARWTILPEAPLSPGPAHASGDTNNWVFVVTPGRSATDPPAFALFDVNGPEWTSPTLAPTRRLPTVDPVPVPPGVGYEVLTATGEEPLLVSYQSDGTAITSTWLGPGWTRPVSVPLPATGGGCPAIDRPALAWIRLATDDDGAVRPVGLIARDGWRRTTQPPRRAVTDGMLVWGPRHLVVADALLAYDTVTGRWLRLPPLPGGARTGVSAAWGQGRLVVWGGTAGDGRLPASGWVFTPDPEPGTLPLPGGGRDGYGDCGGVGIDESIRMRGDRSDPGIVWFTGGGRRYETAWPDGFVARFDRGRVRVIGPDGRVVAREGDRLRDVTQGYCYGGDVISF